MTKEAIITAVFIQLLIASFTFYFFYKVLNKPSLDKEK